MTKLLMFLTLLTYLNGPGATAQSVSPSPQTQAKSGAPPSNAHLIFQEKSRDASPNGEFIHYVLRADGLPESKSYFLHSRWMNGKTARVPEELHIDKSGRLLRKDGDQLDVVLGGTFPGEFILFALVSDDGAAKAFGEITPVPIQAAGKGDCRLTVRPVSIKGEMFSISGEGFKPDQKIKAVATSSGEVMDAHVDNKGGNLKLVLFPAVVGKSGGDASVTASDTSCSVTVHYAWGDAMTKLSPTANRVAPEAQPTAVMSPLPTPSQSAGTPTTNAAIAKDEIDKLVGLRLSPGAVALLAGHGSDARITARLKTALADPGTAIRHVAARVAAVQKIVALSPDLVQTLDREEDVYTAREELQALCMIAGESADPEVMKIARKFSPRLDGFVARLVGRLRGVRALLVYNSGLRELSLSASDRRAFFELVSRDQPADVLGASASLALGRSATEDLRAVLEVASKRNITLQEGMLNAGLRAKDPRIRSETAWYLATTYRKGNGQVPTRVAEAIEQAPPAADPEQRFGFELLHRVLGRPPREDDEWIASLESSPECHLDLGGANGALLDVLTDREREALAARNWKSGRLTAQMPRGAAFGDRDATEGPGLRLISGLPKGVSSDLLTVGGCRNSGGTHHFGVADVEYRDDGLPNSVHMSPHGLPECQRTAAALFLMSRATGTEESPALKGKFLAVFDPGALVCSEDSDLLASEGCCKLQRVEGAVVAPKLNKKVEPFYPIQSRKLRHEGVNIYEAIISADGCVRNIRLLKGSHPDLDAPGMEALAQWRYTPATLNGRPISVYMTVTVTFSLKK